MQKKKIIYSALGLILGILVICAYLYIFNNLKGSENLSHNYDFKIVADSFDTTGIDLNSAFIITANEDYSASDVKDVLSVSPEIEYDLDKSGYATYLLKPKDNLLGNSIYNISVKSGEDIKSWAFQTKSEFKITSTIPINDSICMNLNSGIQIDFSKKVDNISNFFEISPKIEGTFKYVGKTATFVPNKPLTDGETYTVILKAGLQSIDGDKLKEDYTFSFKAEAYQFESGKLFLRSEKENFSTADTQVISFAYGQKDFKGEFFDVNIYNLKTHENYLNLLKAEEIDVTGYEVIKSFKDHLIYDTNSYRAYIKLPENLPVGWYVAEVTNTENNINLKQLIQVSDIAIYLQGVKGNALIWCNDIQTGDILANTDVRIGDKPLKTNENGVVLFKADGKNEIVVSLDDGRRFAEYIDFTTDFENAKYNIYVYTDRESYKPTDTINYWGIIVAKDAKEKLPKTIELYFGEQLVGENITVNSSGIFTGSFDIENQISMYNEIYVGIGDAHYYAKGIIIEDYIKPSYILDFEFDKEYYRRNDIAEIDISGSYFDSNPASNLELNLRIGNDTEAVKLDEMGNETIKYALNNINRQIWEPAYIYAYLQTSGADEDASTGKNFIYCPTDYALETEVIDNELIIKSSLIDFSQVVTASHYTERLIGEACGGVSGKVNVYRTDYIKTATGTYYDFINKTNKTKYSYSTKKTLVDTFDFITNSTGVAAIPIDYEVTEDCYYSFEMIYNMPDGFEGKMSGSLSKNIYPNSDTYYYFEPAKSSLKTNEEVLVKITGSNGFENKGRVLYSAINEEIQEVALTKNTEFKFKFNEKYIPNILLVGVYFDGTDYYTIDQRYLYYSYSERELDILITTDKESYAPGDTVKVNVEAKDKNGNPAKTNMVISVVDEAAFAINDQYPDPLPELYSSNWYYPMTYISTNVLNEDFIGGEGGGGGDAGTFRDYFKDTAAFLTIKTGSNGKTNASFKLPDNTTSWRITVVGITDNLRAGYKTYNVISTLPFYTNIVMNEKYNIGDDITFSLKSTGENLPLLSSSIKYEVKLIKDEEVINTEKVYQLPFKSVNVNMGKALIAGDYKVEVKSECGVYKDTFVKEFSVENSLHEINIVKDIDFTTGVNVDAVKYPVRLMFYDVDNKLYYDVIDKILSTSLGMTNEQQIARNEVSKKLEYIKEVTIRNLQDYDGGVKLLNYSGSDAMLTAKICAIMPEYIDTFAAKRYLNYILESEQTSFEQKTAAYFGLAALKEPVLNDIKYLLANSSEFSIQEKLNLITGLAYIGDYEGATKYYTELIKPRISKTEEDAYIYSYDKYESYSTTSFLTVLLAKLKHEDLSLVANYVVKTESKEYTPALDLIEFIRNYNPKTESEGLLRYAIDGKEEIVNFNEKNNFVLTLAERELKKFEILESNKIAGKVMYVGTLNEAADLYANEIKIEKIISGGSGIGDIRTVTIKVKTPSNLAKEEHLVVNDIVPSGMRFVGTENWHFKDAQKVRFIISNYDKKSEYVIRYSVRNVLKGEYAVESAVVVNPKTNEIGFTEQDTIAIE